jgi:hypothetical protein
MVVNQPLATQPQVVYQLQNMASEKEKKDAKMSEHTLMLFGLSDTVDWETGDITNHCLPKPTSPSQSIFGSTCPNYRAKIMKAAWVLSNREVTKKAVFHIMSKSRSLYEIQPLLVKLLLKGEMTQTPATTIATSSTSVNWAQFFPQQEDSEQIRKLQEEEMERSNQDLHDEEGVNK